MRVVLFAVLAPLFLFLAYHVLLGLVALWVFFLSLVFGITTSIA